MEPRYVGALRREIERQAWQWEPETVYLGGGTPSLMDGDALQAILGAVPGKPWAEATMEAAPGTLTRERIRSWRECGINRVSLGVQSFVQSEIARTGRKQTAEVVADEVALLRECGIENFNIDLIAGLAGQTAASWRESLGWIERLDAPHVSVYMLEIDEDSRLGSEVLLNGQRYGAREIPSEELTADLYEAAVERLAARGIARYEISNFARAGWESKHNLKYWRLAPYVGFGADAHSFDGTRRRQNAETIAEYIEQRGPAPETTAANLTEEKFFVGLRLAEGVRPNAEEWRLYEAPLSRFLKDGLLERRGDAVRLSNRGVLLSNEVFQEFLGK